MRRAPAAAAAAAPANAGAKKAPGNTLAEIQRLQKERDERRKAMEQFKNDRALEEQRNRENGTPGDVDFQRMIRAFRSDATQMPSEEAHCVNEDKICICVRKRPISQKEVKRNDHDSVSCSNPFKAGFLLAFIALIGYCVVLGLDRWGRGLSVERPGVDLKQSSAAVQEIQLRGTAEVAASAAPTLKPTAAPISTKLATSTRSKGAEFLWSPRKSGEFDVHFIHIPKCGGTSMTAILRQVSCLVDPVRNADCCKNQGFCDWHAERRCLAIRGCTNHFPQRQYIFRPLPSITIFREPVSRLISAWFYRGHSPNLDFFQVRPEFKDIKDGKRPLVVFDEYLDMPEYQNIITRMLGADSFPYKNVTITETVYRKALDALKALFFVGLQEAYELSVKVLLRELDVHSDIPILKERDQTSNAQAKKRKNDILNNATAMNKIRAHNTFDVDLYRQAVRKFCLTTAKYPDLFEQLASNKRVDCGDIKPAASTSK